MRLLLGLLLSLIVALSSVGLLALAGWLICAAALAGFHPATAQYFNYFMPAAGIRFLAISRILSRYAERVVTHDVTFRILTRLRVWFYQKIEPLVPAYFMRYPTTDLLNRSVSDVDVLDQAYLRILMPFVVSLSLSAFIFSFFSVFSHEIAWVVSLMMLIVIIAVCVIASGIAYRVTKALQLSRHQFRHYLIDFVSGLKALLLFSAEKRYLLKIENAQSTLYRFQKKLSQLQGLVAAIMIVMSGFSVWLVLYLALPLLSAKSITAPVLCLLVFAVLASFEVLMPLPRAFLNIGEVSLAVGRIKSFSRHHSEVLYAQKNHIRLENFSILVKNVNFSYTDQLPILKNFNLTVAENEKILIEGPSGIGKTSLLNLFARVYDPNAGEILIGGQPILSLSEEQLRNTVTLITQQDYFFNDTVKANLQIAAPAASEESLWNVLDKVGLASTVKKRGRGLEAEMGEFGERFSAGQLRRFSIARALLRDTPILLLDEPVEGLDEENAIHIWSLLQQTAVNKTLIIVSHLRPTIEMGGWRRVAIFEQTP